MLVALARPDSPDICVCECKTLVNDAVSGDHARAAVSSSVRAVKPVLASYRLLLNSVTHKG